MGPHPRIVDVSTNPELEAIAQEVCDSKEPRTLVRDGVAIAEIVPVAKAHHANASRPTPEQLARFLATAGALPEFDVEAFERNRRESRAIPARPRPIL